MDLDLFYGKVKFGNFYRKKVKTVDFLKHILACDLKDGRCRQLIKFMKAFLDLGTLPFKYEN